MHRSAQGKPRGMMFRGVAVAGVLGLLLAACGGDDDTTDPAEPADEGAAEEPADEGDDGEIEVEAVDAGIFGDCAGGEEVELLIWGSRGYYNPPDEGAPLEEACPNISLSWDVQSNDDILQQLQRMQSAGQKMPDIIHDDTFLWPAYKELGLLRPHDDIFESWQEEAPELYDALLPIVFEETTYDGEQWGVSPMANFDYAYYSIPLFESVGITEEPEFESYEELLDVLVQIKEENPDSVPMSVQALAGDGVTMLKNMLGTAGAPWDGAVPDLTSSGGVYLIDWLVRAQEAGLLPADAISWGESESRGNFINGSGGFIIDGLTTAADFAAVDGFDFGSEWGTFMIPDASGEGDEGEYMTSARTWAMTSDVANPEAAGLVLRYLSTAEVLMATVEGGGAGPRHVDAIESDELREMWPHWSDAMQEAFLSARGVPAGANASEVEAILEQMWGEIVVGTDKSAEELAEEYQPQIDETADM